MPYLVTEHMMNCYLTGLYGRTGTGLAAFGTWMDPFCSFLIAGSDIGEGTGARGWEQTFPEAPCSYTWLDVVGKHILKGVTIFSLAVLPFLSWIIPRFNETLYFLHLLSWLHLVMKLGTKILLSQLNMAELENCVECKTGAPAVFPFPTSSFLSSFLAFYLIAL